jgi:DNA-binding MarR family transcriptional regulator
VSVIDSTVALFHGLKVVAETLYRDLGLSAGMRGVLRNLDLLGPCTVPQLARMRPVSRQHIQGLVNPMIDWGYIELLDNPDHKRSPLLSLTESGKKLVNRINRREAELCKRLRLGAPTSHIAITAEVLECLRECIETGRMVLLAEEIRSGESK